MSMDLNYTIFKHYVSRCEWMDDEERKSLDEEWQEEGTPSATCSEAYLKMGETFWDSKYAVQPASLKGGSMQSQLNESL